MPITARIDTGTKYRARAKLIKHATADGLLEMKDNIPLGTVYQIFAYPVELAGVHVPTGTAWRRMMYEVVDGGWLPTEILEIIQ